MDYFFSTQTRLYFVMPFVGGGELGRILKKNGNFAEKDVRFYTVQIIQAIGYLHESNIIYRDLKPENILLNDDGYIMLADFGLAKIM